MKARPQRIGARFESQETLAHAIEAWLNRHPALLLVGWKWRLVNGEWAKKPIVGQDGFDRATKKPPDVLATADTFRESDFYPGYRPGSIGRVHFDVDTPGATEDQVRAAFPGALIVRSHSGNGFHAVYMLPTNVSKWAPGGKWSHAGLSGEVLCMSVYAAIGNLDSLGKLLSNSNLSPLPRELRHLLGKRVATNRAKPRPKAPAPVPYDRIGDIDIDRLRDAFPYVQGDNFDDWGTVLYAFKHDLGEPGWALFDEWSRLHAGGKYDPALNRDRWDRSEPDGRCTLGTFFHQAKVNGWRPTPRRPVMRTAPKTTEPEPEPAREDGRQEPDFDPPPPDQPLAMVGKGRNLPRLQNIFEHMGWLFRYNIRARKPELKNAREPEHPVKGWTALTDQLTAWIVEAIAQNVTDTKSENDTSPFPARWSLSALAQSLAAWAWRDQFDPFHAWIASLPAWDQIPRLDKWLADLFQADHQDPLALHASRAILVGPLQRTIRLGDDHAFTGPGAKIDEMPVLFGKQGIGKSSVIRQLLPPEMHAAWFVDSFDFTLSNKEQTEALLGRVLVENSELAGIHGSDLNRLKATVTRTHLAGTRMAYERHVQDFPRRDFIIGSTDREDCLPNDSQGNRRFYVVNLPTGSNVEDYMNRNRIQLWAEALHRYQHDGLRANLPRDLHDQRTAANEGHRSKDLSFEDSIRDVLESNTVRLHLEEDPDGFLSLQWIAAQARVEGRNVTYKDEHGETRTEWEPKWPISRQAQQRTAEAIRNCRWTRRKKLRTFIDPDGSKKKTFPWHRSSNPDPR